MRGIICYDFSDDKARTRCVKILSKYGSRIQYSVFEFKLDKLTWQKLVQELHKKKFLDGNHNIVIIPITDKDHSKIIYLGDFFMAFDYSTLLYTPEGIHGIGEKESKLRTNKKYDETGHKVEKAKAPVQSDIEKAIMKKIFGK
jgi:CRISPR-associated protein Cas2